ncbi:hypothetical protein DTW91_09605 [Chryseobacterium sp. SC28]|nr:hypothetical protein DTW91_09605 [Chryseobacterium sp. SC28]
MLCKSFIICKLRNQCFSNFGKEIVDVFLYKVNPIKTTAMAISYYDFKNLPNHSQCDIVLNHGQLMNETMKDGLKFVLYQISSFFVELVYSHNNRIAAMNVFQNNSVLVN